MNKRELYLYWGAITFIIFIAFSLFVASGFLFSIDYSFMIYLQGVLPAIFITPFSLFSVFGTIEILFLVLLVSVFLFKNAPKISIIILFILVAVVEVIGKILITQIPPPIELLKTNLHLGVPSGGVSHHLFAYPSGHSARTAFIATFFIIMIWTSDKYTKLQKQIITGVILLISFMMYISRVYLGEHWITDVIGGALLGTSLALFIGYLLHKKTT